MASTSASPSYAHNNCNVYDVFINHRGPDCKKPFATDLYNRLREYRLQVFLDQQELQEGEDLTSQIKGAIRKASLHIAIFSQNYAESNWCLDELRLMLQSGPTILPVFFVGVKPSDLRWTGDQHGVYARALRNLEKKTTFDIKTQIEEPRYDSITIKEWRQALSVAADISGFEYKGDEHQLIQQVVEEVLKKVKRSVYVSKYPIGLDLKVEDFERVVGLGPSSETRVLGILGLGGVGKTTLAKEIFNRQLSKYDRSCHLSDVTNIESSQKQLLEELGARNWNGQIYDIGDGIGKIKRYLPSTRALIILDNVDHMNQLNALLVPVKDSIQAGSLILVTSRNKDVLTNGGIEESHIYKLEGLDPQRSQELFCLHAFGQPHPVAGFERVVKEFLVGCQGLPLSLEVIGALLYGNNDLGYWEAQLKEISTKLHDDILGRLRISYAGLDPKEKQMFLDVACFFIRQDINTAIRIWDGSGWNGWLGVRKLENRCLMEVDSKNCITMHDHLRDLGRYIGETDPPSYRLWRPTDNLLHNLLDKFPVRGIDMVHQYAGSEWPDPQSFKTFAELQGSRLVTNMSNLQLLRAVGNFVESIFSVVPSQQRVWLSPQLVWLCWHSCPFTSLPPWIPLNKLRVLEIKGSELETLWPDECQAPLLLRELIIDAPLSKLPVSIGKLTNLEKIILYRNERVQEVNLKTFLDELCHLKSLQCLVLRNCSNMKSLPDSFVNLTNLEHIDISGCSNLQKLPNSFGKLKKLQLIDLSGCLSLKTFPPRRWKRKEPPRIE